MPSKLVLMSWDDSGNVPGVTPPLFPTNPIAPGGQPPYPSQGPGFPTNPIYIPGGGWVTQLPVFPFDPTHPIAPGGEEPTHPIAPGGERPSHQPIVPGAKFVVKWLACQGLILVPDNSLPLTPEPK